METKIAIFWSDFADKFKSDERAAKALSGYGRVPIQAARDEIAAARAHLADPLFNQPVAREIIRDILDKAGAVEP